jgi:hypothetical protein
VIILSIDPGKKVLPYCVWQDNVLTHAGLSVLDVSPRLTADSLAHLHVSHIRQRWTGKPDRVFVEQMQLNTGRDSTRGKAIATGNDLLMITHVASTVASLLGGQLVHVPIGTWKGTAPKTVTMNRARATLALPERAVMIAAMQGVRASLHHNLYDAAGIGLWACGRYVVRRGYAG